MIDAKIHKTQTALFEAACRLFTQGGSPSLAMIAEEAGVGRATLHRHFSTRERFINEMTLWAVKVLEGAQTNTNCRANTSESAFWQIIEALISHGDKYNFLLYESQELSQSKLKKNIVKSNGDMKNMIIHLQKNGTLNPNVTANWINSVVDALIYSAWEQIHKGDLAPNTAGALVRQTLLNGFGFQHQHKKGKP